MKKLRYKSLNYINSKWVKIAFKKVLIKKLTVYSFCTLSDGQNIYRIDAHWMFKKKNQTSIWNNKREFTLIKFYIYDFGILANIPTDKIFIECSKVRGICL